MKISLKHKYTFFFLLGVFFIPFNSYEGIPFLGEFKKESSIVFFLLAIVFFFIEAAIKKSLKFPFKNIYFQFLIVFVIWIFVSLVFNFPTILSNYIKQTSGLNRFFRQFLSLVISLLFFLSAYNIISKYSLKTIFLKIRKILLYSFIFVCFYSFIEIFIVKFNLLFLIPFFRFFDYFPFLETSLDFTHGRISSVSHEPPFLAIYLITIAGWMFSYLLTSKSILRFLPLLLIFIITFFSGSRTALVVIFFQFLIFIGISITVDKRIIKLIKNIIVVALSLLFLVIITNSKNVTEEIDKKINSLNFKKNLSKSVSNKSRLGIQYTSLIIFKNNPIFGVGFGQQAYKARSLYPSWATNRNWEFKYYYLNDNDKSFPPGYNIYTRLLAETGIIGFLLFAIFLWLILKQTLLNKKRAKKENKSLSVILFISFTGFIVNWLQFDSFRVFGFWICLALLILQTKLLKKSYE